MHSKARRDIANQYELSMCIVNQPARVEIISSP